MKNKIFFKPANGVVADIIPFFEKNQFHLFYLHDFRNSAEHGEGTPWFHLASDDLTSYVEEGEALPRGSVNDQDLYVFTGSVIKVGKTFHIFYTGHNPHFRQNGKPEQAVMHATSADLKTWKKIPEDTFYAPKESYESHDWRDPFVFYNAEENNYWMLLAARLKDGESKRQGCTALCTSKDLKTWTVEEPLWSPHFHFTHECPDLFKIGSWYYLIYSEFSDRRITRYRMAKDLKGPWLSPKDDQFDGRSFYAAKSISDGKNRFLFGWVPTKAGNKDSGAWQWGGNLMAHHLYQKKNGELGEKPVASIQKYFSAKKVYAADEVQVDALGACHFVDLPLQLPESFRVSLDVTFDAHVTRAGISLRHDQKVDDGYVYALDASRQQFMFDRFPNDPWEYTNFVGSSRYYSLKNDTVYHVEVLVEGDVCVAYVNDELALSSRMYRQGDFPLALFAMDGKAQFKNVVVTTPEGE